MNIRFSFLTTAFLLMGLIARAQDLLGNAGAFLSLLQKKEYAEALEKYCASSFQMAVPEEKIATLLQQLTEQYGDYERIAEEQASPGNPLMVQVVFEKFEVPVSFSFDDSSLIQGFFIKGSPKARGIAQSSSTDGEEEINIKVNGGVISGSLLLPRQKREKMPLAIVIAGSGPTDRNGNNPYGISANPYYLLAKALAEAGIASYRYDKRLIGSSATFNASDKELLFSDFSDDAAYITQFFKGSPAYGKVVLIGHSEGSNIGLLSAQKTAPDALVSLSGAGENLADILGKQLIVQPDLAEKAEPILAKLKAGERVGQVPPELNALFSPSVQPFLITSFKIYPAEEIKKLQMPLLVIGGTTDLQVPTENAEKLKAAAPNAELLLITGMNHVLKDAPADREGNLATYSDATLPVHADLVNGIIRFVQGLD